MKKIAVAAVLILSMVLSACGSNVVTTHETILETVKNEPSYTQTESVETNDELTFPSVDPQTGEVVTGIVPIQDSDNHISYVYLDEQGLIPTDVPKTVFYQDDLYYINDDGSVAIDQTVGYLYFDEEGKYTSGDSNIDANVKELLSELVTDSMAQEEMLLAAYHYICDYLDENIDHYRPWVLGEVQAYPAFGATDFTREAATYWFENRCGNCFCYCSLFLYLARQLGYQAYPVCGKVIVSDLGLSSHAWVMIEWPDGSTYSFDPELGTRFFPDPEDLYKFNPYVDERPYYHFP